MDYFSDLPRLPAANVNTSNKIEWFTLKKKSRRYLAETIMGADYSLFANAPALTESLLHRLEQAAKSIGRHVSSHKTEFMCGAIFSLNGKPPTLIDQFIYLGSNISSTFAKSNSTKMKVIGRLQSFTLATTPQRLPSNTFLKVYCYILDIEYRKYIYLWLFLYDFLHDIFFIIEIYNFHFNLCE